MKKSSAQAGGNAGLFLTHRPERMTSKRTSQRSEGAGDAAHDLIPGIVKGERVLIHKPRPMLEKGIEIRIRVALSTAGVLVMKHHVDNRGQKPCVKCGHKDPQRGARTGLGLGVSDLICVVPPHGRFLGIEVKRPGYSPSDVREDQKRWLNVVRRFGGITGIATSEEEALALVELARRA
jgi:hypothetical protein